MPASKTDERSCTMMSEAERFWDSESRRSPYSTVADPREDDYCEGCDSTVDYSDGSEHGRCAC
jgi:hypothetical protein